MNNVIGIVNLHADPEISPLTDNRPLGSFSFLGRYAFVDFPLSAFCNAGIETVGILVKDHLRSVMKHLGSMDAWVNNTKIGQEIVMYNEPAHLHPETNTDINNIRENDWVLYDSDASYILIAPSHIVGSIDVRPILAEHIHRKDKVTVVATRCLDARKEFLKESIISIGSSGYVEDVRDNDGTIEGPCLASLGIYVVNRTVLADMIHRYAPKNPTLSLDSLIYAVGRESGGTRPHVYIYDGFVRAIDSFKHYMDYSFELFDEANSKALFRPDWPIYTLTHDTPPAMYGKEAVVSNSFIANGAVVEGTVINSIIGRNVKVAKTAVVKDSIILSSSMIGDGAMVSNALVDKYAIITRSHKVTGTPNSPVYVAQGAIL